jgi:zinc protease
MSFWLRSLLICGFLASATSAQAAVFNAASKVLDNGLQVVVVTNRLAPVVTHMLWIKAGAADDTAGKSGLAHYLEHLMFKGTAKVPNGDYSRRIAQVGGTENAFTMADATAFYATVAKEQLPMVMELEADRLTHLQIQEKLAKPELAVVLDERRQRVDSEPTALFAQQMASTLFPAHPYGRPVIGWKEEIEGLKVADADAFYRRWYQPANALVIISGDVGAEEAFRMAEKYYGGLSSGTAVIRQRRTDPPFSGDVRVTAQEARMQETLIERVVKVPSRHTSAESAYALEVLQELLAGSDAAFLQRRLIQEKKLASRVEVDYDADSYDLSTFSMTLTPNAGVKPEAILDALETALKDFASQPVTAQAMDDAKRSLKRQAYLTRDSNMGPAYIIGMALTAGERLEDIESWPEHISAVTADQVQKAAQFIMTLPKVTGILLPQAGEKGAPPAPPASEAPMRSEVLR